MCLLSNESLKLHFSLSRVVVWQLLLRQKYKLENFGVFYETYNNLFLGQLGGAAETSRKHKNDSYHFFKLKSCLLKHPADNKHIWRNIRVYLELRLGPRDE